MPEHGLSSPLVYFTAIAVLGIVAQWLAWRIRLPAILLLLAAGFGLGQAVDSSQYLSPQILRPIVSLSVAIILFEGGLSLRVRELQAARSAVLRLITVGLAIAWVLNTAAAHLVFSTTRMAALAGAIYVVTGPTVIGPLLRQIRPSRRAGAMARWEGIVNDPLGALLTVLVYEAALVGAVPEAARIAMTGLVQALSVGIVLGAAGAGLIMLLLARHWLPDYLHVPVMLATVLASFTASDLILPESGLMTVTVMGLILANQQRVDVHHLIEFKENLGVLLISWLFIVLSSQIDVSDLTDLGLEGLLFLAAIILVVRPLTIFLATIGTDVTWQEKVFLSCLAPRGIVAVAVASVFALKLTTHMPDGQPGHIMAEEASRLVPLTFLVIVGTVTFYGLAAGPVARLLGIADIHPQGILFAGAGPFARKAARAVSERGYPVLLVDTNHSNLAAARMAGLRVCHANVLSEYVREETDMGGIGRLLAVTPNDEVNALAALEFADQFGRSEVYQLSRGTDEKPRTSGVSRRLRGRFLFSEEATFSFLASRVGQGAVIRTTAMTEEFGYSNFRQLHGDTALILFIVDLEKNLRICTVTDSHTPRPGETLVWLPDPMAPAPEENEPTDEAASNGQPANSPDSSPDTTAESSPADGQPSSSEHS
ncbi:MAG: sodium:proton antiporter [Planctomycetaceae bacterium]|nr:sodium:proton antiporter [Planctomycetaceae bacterium]